jgi:leucyl aminopeptidase
MIIFEDAMLAQLTVSPTLPKTLNAAHVLVLLPKSKALPSDLPERDLLTAVLKRRNIKADEFADAPIAANHANGSMMVWAMVDFSKSVFAMQTQIRKAMQLLLDEHPSDIAIVVQGDDVQRQQIAEQAVYSAWVNGALLPLHKKKDTRKALKKIALIGVVDKKKFDGLQAQAEGNILCRSLTVLPPNELTPANYRQRVKKLAQENKWQLEEFDMKALRKMGAGAFVAVAQGSHDDDAAIVHLTYRHAKAKQTVALVGKGICFDTGGHNLKPARYMNGMHEDMNGSAVALGILLAATQQKLAVNIDCWLAIAQNHIGPKAYKQNDIVTALNGTTIEIMHTDAEGRMVLADTLTLAAREKPNFIIDFATLTGSMAVALGARYSGVLGNRVALLQAAVQAGQQCGERLCAFPLDEDYEPALDSKVADIKQCTLDGEADHILAARFLKRFLVSDVSKKSTAKSDEEPAWLHVDLSASRCEGGLGSVASDVTGFGVAWGLRMLRSS